jgi:hypothetical protein
LSERQVLVDDPAKEGADDCRFAFVDHQVAGPGR